MSRSERIMEARVTHMEEDGEDKEDAKDAKNEGSSPFSSSSASSASSAIAISPQKSPESFCDDHPQPLRCLRMTPSSSLSSTEFDSTFDSSADAHSAQEDRLDQLRQDCLNAVNAATSHTVLGSADVTAYRDDVLSDRALLLSGITDEKAKLNALMETRTKYIPAIIDDARQLERKFEQMIADAVRAGGISEKDGRKWMDRLRDSNVIYRKKKEFINEKIERVYMPNWMKLGEDLQKIETKRKELKLKPGDLPELAKLNTSGFLDMHFLTKRDYANKAEAALAAFEKGEYKELDQTALYQQAQEQLAAAVEMGALAPWKVGEWLKRIFVKNAKPEKMRNFVEGKGETDRKSTR